MGLKYNKQRNIAKLKLLPTGKVSHAFGKNGTIVTQLSKFLWQLYHFVRICEAIEPFGQTFPDGLADITNQYKS